MKIGTEIFQRIIKNLKDSAVRAIAATMTETVRFGCFSKEYVKHCAEDRMEEQLKRKKTWLKK